MQSLYEARRWRVAVARDQPTDADALLVPLAQRGDAEAMEELLARHEDVVATVCLGMLGNREDARDAVQETFYRALRALPRFNRASSFRTWLYRIAVNTCLNHRRSAPATEPLHEMHEVCSAVDSPEHETLDRLETAAALAQLLPRQRALIVLREVEQLSAQEIGRAMGWSEKKVRNELYRARQTLRAWAKSRQTPDTH